MSLPRRPRHTTHARPVILSLFTRARHAIRRSALWKTSSGIIAAALAIGMVAVGVALPASAHTPNVSVTCSAVSVNLQNYQTKPGDPTPNTVKVTLNSTVVLNTTAFGASFTGKYDFPSSAAGQTYKVEVKAFDDSDGSRGWTKTFQGNNGSGCVATDASATVNKTAPTCSSAELLVLGDHINSTWGTPVYTNNQDGTRSYSVVATADSGHTFASGNGVSNSGKTKTFTGTLVKQLTQNCQTASCIPASNVSYTYLPATNSGTITVKDVPGSTHELCKGFWVTATSWTYRGHSMWPQDIDVIQKLAKITTFGTYDYVAAVGCGQGDIYASYTAQPDPYTQPVVTAHPVLTGPNTPFAEHFLHEMGFSGPTPTYTNADIDCFLKQDASAVVTVTPPTCTAPAVLHRGAISNATFSGDKDGMVGPANYTVTATADTNHVFTAGLPGVSADKKTQVFSGSLAGPLGYQTTKPGDPCYSIILGDPLVTPATCVNGVSTSGSIWVDLKPGEVTYKITGPNGLVIDPVITATNSLPAGDYTVAATALPGFHLTGTTQWKLTVAAAAGNCSIVTPTSTLPSKDLACPPTPGAAGIDGSFTLPNTPGISWFVGGKATAAGTYTVTTAQTVDVTAKPASSSWGFPAGATTSWSLVFTTPKDCQLTTHAELLTAVTSTNEICSTSGAATGGSITVAQVDDGTGISDLFATGGVTYFIDGVQVTSATTPKAAGTYHVTATADDPVNDVIVGASSWTITIASAAQACGQLTTLPFTGVSGNPIGILLIALLLLVAGTGVYTASRIRPRTQS